MTAFAKLQIFLMVAFIAALAAMTAMTYHRAGAHGIYAPWAWFDWFHLYARRRPWLYLGDMAIGLAAFATPVAITLWLLNLSRTPGALEEFGKDAWATTKHLKKAGIKLANDKISGRIIGEWNGKMMVYEGDEPALVVGGTRSGKGAGHVVPTLLSWTGSAMIHDRKGELWQITADHRKKFSHCILYDPTSINTIRWNPLFEVRWGRMEIADIQNVVIVLIDPTGAKQGDLDFWQKSAGAFYVAIILHILYTAPDNRKTLAEIRRQMGDMPRLLHDMLNTVHRNRPDYGAEDGLARDANGHPIPEPHPEVVRGAMVFKRMEEKVQSSVTATMETALDLWADPNVDYATSWSDFMIGDLMCADHPITLYIVVSQAHAERLAFLTRVFLRSTVNSLMESEFLDSRGRRKKHRLLMMIDEFPTLGYLPFIQSALSEMTSFGFTAHFICQNFQQIYDRYGQTTSLFGNFLITAICGVGDDKGFDEVTKRAGKVREMRRGFSDPRGLISKGHRSVSTSEQLQDLLHSGQLREMPKDEQLLFITGTKPIRSKKLRYFENPTLKAAASDYFHDNPDLGLAQYQQRRGRFDTPRQTKIDWVGVEPIVRAPPYVPPPPKEKRGKKNKSEKSVLTTAAGADSTAGLPPQAAAAPIDLDTVYAAGLKDLERDD